MGGEGFGYLFLRMELGMKLLLMNDEVITNKMMHGSTNLV